MRNIYDSLKKKIDSTQNELTRIKETYDEGSLEYRMMTNQLDDRLQELIAEQSSLYELENKEKLIITLSGDEIRDEKVSARVLSSLLSKLQSITDSIANAIGNEPTLHGKIPDHILEKADLYVIRSFPGSFGLELEGYTQDNLFDEEPLLTKTLGRFFNLLSSGADEDVIFNEIAELGTRTFMHYKQWLKLVNDYNIEVDCNWESGLRGTYSWKISRNYLPSVIRALDNIREEEFEEEIEMPAKITGINIRKQTFEVMDPLEHVFTGKSSEELLRKAGYYVQLDQYVNLSLIKHTIKNITTGDTKINWRLLDISDMN